MAGGLAVLVLAAGKGTRMKSKTIKVLHPLMGRPMLAHVLNSAKYLNPEKTVVVVGHQAEAVQEAMEGMDVSFALQKEQLGTGHAVESAKDEFTDFKGTVLILSGDVPLLSPQTMMDFLEAHRQSNVLLSVLTVALQYPANYGRIVRDEKGYLLKIVEARDATMEEYEINEINSGIYAVDSSFLFSAVRELDTDNDQKEYYLTDIVEKLRSSGKPAAAILCPDPEEVMGINDRAELAEAIDILRVKTNHAWMQAGVTLIDPNNTYIETTVKIDNDVTIWPGTNILGKTQIGNGAVIEANCWLTNSIIGQDVVVKCGTVLDSVIIADGAVIGPLEAKKY